MTPERATVPTSIFRIGITKRDFHLGNTRHDPVFIASPSSACPPCSHKHYKHPPSPVHETNGPNNPVNHSDSTAHNRHVKHTTTHSHASHTPTYRNQTIKHIATTHCLSSGSNFLKTSFNCLQKQPELLNSKSGSNFNPPTTPMQLRLHPGVKRRSLSATTLPNSRSNYLLPLAPVVRAGSTSVSVSYCTRKTAPTPPPRWPSRPSAARNLTIFTPRFCTPANRQSPSASPQRRAAPDCLPLLLLPLPHIASRLFFQPTARLSLLQILLVLAFLLGARVLVLLVLRHQIVHVALRLRELHLVHALARVPMQESLPPEHGCELLAHTPEHLLNRRRVTDERRRHLQTRRGNVTHTRLHVVRNPLHEVRRILVLHVDHLLVHLLRRHLAPEHRRRRQIPTVPGPRTSYSSSPTFAESTREPSAIDTAENPSMST
uniref:Uncharacterized protein n=1 Tax=Physcomitrium patens TaxID=3218 RepID=A0A7I4C4Z2_PHYPA